MNLLAVVHSTAVHSFCRGSHDQSFSVHTEAIVKNHACAVTTYATVSTSAQNHVSVTLGVTSGMSIKSNVALLT
uniref:Uncharacterized protein n=1 Tax=Arion vulgaris TaxID=1028688 RepID=A0A0B6ZP82_9EUPU